MKENFFSIKPKDKRIKQLIDHYYFQEVDNEGGIYSVYYYPNYRTALNYYENAKVVWDDQGRTITQSDTQSSHCFFTQNIKTSRYVTIYGSVHKIGIVFKPLGINYFIDTDLNKIAKNSIGYFDYFGKDFLLLLKSLKNIDSLEEKRDCFDKFFLKIYLGFTDENFKKLIDLMIHSTEEYSVNKIASLLSVNRKTVLRKFKRHLCTSPTDFISLRRFRNALHKYKNDVPLTAIAYDCNYYDQSDFIKDYKKIAGLTPKQLFKRISEKGENETLWTRMQ